MDDDDARERGDGSIWTVQDFIAYIDRHTDAKVHKITGKGLTEVPADISRIKEHSVRYDPLTSCAMQRAPDSLTTERMLSWC